MNWYPIEVARKQVDMIFKLYSESTSDMTEGILNAI